MNPLKDNRHPRITALLQRVERASKALDKLWEMPVRSFLNGQRFITDPELSDLLRISRRTLQEYRAKGVIPYYIICGKILYMESEIQKFLEKCRKKSLDERELL